MKDFVYCAPTRVVLGRDAENQVGKLLREFGATKVMIHYGGESARRSGLLGRVCRVVEEEGLSYVLLGGVKPNPRLSLVQEGIALGKAENVDFILAVGGGSVIDSAKAIGYGLRNRFDVWDLFEKKAQATDCCPIGAILTIAAAGSEMSSSAVISNAETGMKRGYASEYCRCKFAVMNPELTFTLPPYQTASGATDILMHMMERYFYGAGYGSSEVTDGMAESLMRTVMACAETLMQDPCDYDARADLMWASSLAHNDLLQCGNGVRGDWACHQLEHELGAMFDVAHGAGLAAVWGSWARYAHGGAPERFFKFATRVMGVAASGDREADILAGICAFEEFLRKIGMPTNIRQLGIGLSEAQLDELAYRCTYAHTRTIGTVVVMGEKEIRQVYEMAKG